MQRDLPGYIERGGDIVIRQPLELRGVTVHSFVLAADRDRLTALVARQLNAPAQGAVEYVPAAPVVALVCADIQRGQARDEPDRSKGWMSERDVGFWVPLWAGQRRGSIFIPERLVFFMPYVFVDNVAATTTGREVFGFPKESGVLTFPERPAPEGGVFSVDTLVIRRYQHDSRAEVARLIEVAPAEPRSPSPAAHPDADSHAGHSVMSRLREFLVEDALVPAVDTMIHALHAGARLVFLKQFRDAEDPSRACYQAVLEAPANVDTVRDGGALPEHVVRIAAADSHPIVADLGLAGPSVTALLASWVDFDFTMDRGSVVHRTTG